MRFIRRLLKKFTTTSEWHVLTEIEKTIMLVFAPSVAEQAKESELTRITASHTGRSDIKILIKGMGENEHNNT